ncbi:hypothetical protein [Longitalea luteola]|uniref:hypothetical protein n=1 Tax=Longitalea luteola TaxID=2812563 RepID=UPI001A97D27C|nr:hypothetical protein [Longitalea luteola]
MKNISLENISRLPFHDKWIYGPFNGTAILIQTGVGKPAGKTGRKSTLTTHYSITAFREDAVPDVTGDRKTSYVPLLIIKIIKRSFIRLGYAHSGGAASVITKTNRKTTFL